MADIDTRLAVYSDIVKAEADWKALEAAGKANEIKIADAAFVENLDGEAKVLERQSHHGWGKGAIVGAVVGIVFPPSIIASAAVGAGRWFADGGNDEAAGRGKVMELGSTFDSGTWAIIVAYPPEHASQVADILKGAKSTWVGVSATDEEVEKATSEV